MSKVGYLVKNTGILAIGNFSSKLLTFFLVPLYTAVLTTEEYGAYDIIYSSVSLLIPILTLNIADAVMRFPLEKEADAAGIARVGLLLTLGGGMIVLAAQLWPGSPWCDVQGIGFMVAMFVSSALYQLMSLFARGMEHITDIAVAGILSTVTIVVLNIMLLLAIPCGLNGYFVANISGLSLAACYLFFRLRRYVLSPAKGNLLALAKRMVGYSLPLALVPISWWFINTSGRYIVLFLCGAAANGLFSIAYRIPTILSVVAQIFIQAWQVSAIKDFDSTDEDGFLRKSFDFVEFALVVATFFLIVLSPLIAKLLFSGEFYEAWVYVPFLLISVLFNSMGGLWGPFFSAVYNTRPVTIATLFGGIVNIVVGIPLTVAFGVYGTAFSAIVSSGVNWAFRGIAMHRVMQVDFHMRPSLFVYFLLMAQSFVMISGAPEVFLVVGNAILLGIILFSYRERLADAAAYLCHFATRK